VNTAHIAAMSASKLCQRGQGRDAHASTRIAREKGEAVGEEGAAGQKKTLEELLFELAEEHLAKMAKKGSYQE